MTCIPPDPIEELIDPWEAMYKEMDCLKKYNEELEKNIFGSESIF